MNRLLVQRIVLRSQSTKTTPPRVYEKIKQELEKEHLLQGIQTTPDHIHAIQRAALNKRKSGKYPGFIQRLEQDGGPAILKSHHTFFHVDYTRFIQHCGDIKGLQLDDALLQLDWSQKTVVDKVHEALTEAIVMAKESGFDLSKTYIADAYVKDSKTGVSTRFIKKYLRGRGRYGATPHPKFARLEFVLQQREKGFAVRENDPLEWVRTRLRERRSEFTKNAEEVYQEYRVKRPIKPIYV
jgi:hypothetical protein